MHLLQFRSYYSFCTFVVDIPPCTWQQNRSQTVDSCGAKGTQLNIKADGLHTCNCVSGFRIKQLCQTPQYRMTSPHESKSKNEGYKMGKTQF